MSPPRTMQSEDGFSLAELLVTIVLVGVTFVAILTGLMTAIRVSASHRTQATTDSVTRSAAEWVKDSARHYTNCAGIGAYSFSGLSTPTGYVPVITSVKYWDGSAAPIPTGTYDVASHLSGTCPSDGDKGLQQITVKVTSPDGQITEWVQVL